MKKHAFGLLLFAATVLSACSGTRRLQGDDGKITVDFLQVNDVYEIAPLAGGREGGVARVAALKKQYLQQNPNTFLVIAGDFLSPSVYNSIQYNGKAIRGKQMVEALNAAGLDYAIFGNHEFDIRESELTDRINESRFQWISSNAFHRVNGKLQPFVKNGTAIPGSYIMNVQDRDGTTARIGIIGLVLPFNRADYVGYTDVLASAKELYAALKDSADIVGAFTHLQLKDDIALAKELPDLAFILGGHEHDMRFEKIGRVYITKAHANAKSAYAVSVTINKKKKHPEVSPRLVYLNESIPLDSAASVVVDRWTSIAEKNYSSLGFDAHRIVLKNGEPLDGRESEVRRHSTNLTRLIVKGMEAAVPAADLVLVNAGSIRVDDIVPPPVSEYDIIRSLPFGGGIREADLKGSLLLKVLEAGRANAGIGGFLQYSEALRYAGDTWVLKGAPVDATKTYHVALSDFLFTGKEANLDFLQPANPEVVKTYEAVTAGNDPRSDIRIALIRYLDSLQR